MASNSVVRTELEGYANKYKAAHMEHVATVIMRESIAPLECWAAIGHDHQIISLRPKHEATLDDFVRQALDDAIVRGVTFAAVFTAWVTVDQPEYSVTDEDVEAAAEHFVTSRVERYSEVMREVLDTLT